MIQKIYYVSFKTWIFPNHKQVGRSFDLWGRNKGLMIVGFCSPKPPTRDESPERERLSIPNNTNKSGNDEISENARATKVCVYSRKNVFIDL